MKRLLKYKKINLILIFLITVIFIYFIYTIIKINNYNKIPYCNLNDYSTGGCFIYINVINKKTKYKIVCSNSFFYNNVLLYKGKFYGFIYKPWMYEIIRKNLCVNINDDFFNNIKSKIVEDEILKKYLNKPILNDTNIVINNELNRKLNNEDLNAIIYILLRNNINCCANCESGYIYIKPAKPSM